MVLERLLNSPVRLFQAHSNNISPTALSFSHYLSFLRVFLSLFILLYNACAWVCCLRFLYVHDKNRAKCVVFLSIVCFGKASILIALGLESIFYFLAFITLKADICLAYVVHYQSTLDRLPKSEKVISEVPLTQPLQIKCLLNTQINTY